MISSRTTAIRLLYVAAIVPLATTIGWAASDTDVYVTKAKSVIIEKDKITVVAEAETTKINLFAPPRRIKERPEAKSLDDTGHVHADSSKTPIGYTNRRIFIIRRPILKFNDPTGTLDNERAQYQKTLDDAWEMTLKAAHDLRAGKPVGRIGYYRPIFLPDSIDGFGYLYPGGTVEAQVQE